MTRAFIPNSPIDIYKLPNCPHAIRDTILQSPSTFFLYTLVAFVSTVFAIVIFFQYNAVKLPYIQKKVRSKTISNHMWVIYFVCVAFRAVINCVRYGRPANLVDEKKYLFSMSISAFILHAVTAFVLTLALNYQRIWRSGNSIHEDDEDDVNRQQVNDETNSQQQQQQKQQSTNSDPQDHHYDEADYDDDHNHQDTDVLILNGTRRGIAARSAPPTLARQIAGFFFSINFLAFLLLVFVLFTISFRAGNVGDQIEVYTWIQFGALLLQRTPILLIAVVILFSRRISEDFVEIGPSILSRTILALALLCNILNDIPLGYWYFFFEKTSVATNCVFYVASLFDIVVLLYLVSLFLWFLFMRFEYIRNQEAAMFKAMQKTQSVFDVRFD